MRTDLLEIGQKGANCLQVRIYEEVLSSGAVDIQTGFAKVKFAAVDVLNATGLAVSTVETVVDGKITLGVAVDSGAAQTVKVLVIGY